MKAVSLKKSNFSQTSVNFIARLADSTLVHIAFAFIAMGCWALFANRGYAVPDMLQAGLVQGSLSAGITLVMKKALESLSQAFKRAGQSLRALIAPPLIVCSASLAVFVGTHLLSGTPEIIRTIIVPFSVAFTYACLYSARRWKA